MNACNSVFLNLVLCLNIAVVGMSYSGTGLIAKNLAQLARLNRTKATALLASNGKEIFNGTGDSITLLKEEGCCKKIYTKRLDECVLTAFYMRSKKGLQYASLIRNKDTNYSSHLTHIQKSIKEGIAACAQHKDMPEYMTTIHTVPGQFVYNEKLKRYEMAMVTDCALKLEQVKSALEADAQELFECSKEVRVKCLPAWNVHKNYFDFEVVLCSDPDHSYYANTEYYVSSDSKRILLNKRH